VKRLILLSGLCAALLGWGWRALDSDAVLETERR